MTNSDRKQITFEDIERRLVKEHHKPYFDWLRQVVTLALAALTSLVALQVHYVPQKPIAVFLLATCWASLALAIVFGLLALSAEYKTPLEAVKKIRRMRAMYGDENTAQSINRNSGTKPSTSHQWAVKFMVSFFILGLFAICIFATINLPWSGL